ncbi:hypothetical protein [Paraliomyxa miuraensis]|uniref:hypothetical protein n=1 Tax=Paraliomyxa miuraensis TaxID=376150 RepID=UPI0022592AA5|nr:hypothetical protein [Paraliomyxa miuraensis]MCX4246214.1 hypothetical protein [Paraliomyxa miuraensis]
MLVMAVLGLVMAEPEPDPTTEAAAPATEAPVTEPASPATEAVPLRPPRVLEPRRIVPRNRRPHGRSISRFTTRPPLVRPALRVAPGFSARPTGRPYAAFGFDALASVMLGLHGGYRQWGLAPELGYSLRTPRLDHRLLAGMGLVYGINAESWTVGWLPRVVLQPETGALALGVRNGLWYDFAENGFSVELSHQWLVLGGAPVHELQVTLGLDVAMLLFVVTDARMAWL